jgi:nucleotide-binding universal stress UspA family protein
MKIERILCPTDFSEASAHAIDQAVAIAGWYKARITALHVVLPSVPPLPGRPASTDITARAEGDLEQLRKETAARFAAAARAGIGLDVMIEVGWPARCILERAADLQADLILIGTPRLEELPAEQGLALAEYRRYCEKRAMARLESLVPDSEGTSHPPVSRLRNGKPYVQILDVAAEEKSDLIVLGVRGRQPLDTTLFGSTANQVVRHAKCPVLTLRQ